MSTQATGICARNLPQHFNGCTCTVDPSVTAEADVWLDFPTDLPDVEPATVNVRGTEYVVTHVGDDEFEVDVDGVKVTFHENPNNDDLIEEAAMYAVDARLNRAWGDVTHVKEGSRTPWGAAQIVNHPAPGIASASCAGHGGVKLSKERNAEIPPALRRSSGWYEEDCEAQIVGMYFPETFPHYRGAGVADEDQNEWRREQFDASVKNWFPDEYTKATGTPVSVEESSELRARAKRKDRAAFLSAHSHEFISTHGNTSDSMNSWIPKGYAAVQAEIADTGEKRHFLVPENQVIHDGMWGTPTVIDPAKALDITDVVNAKPQSTFPHHRVKTDPVHGEAIGFAYDHLTESQAYRARAELNKVWRFANDDGTTTTESLAQHMSRLGVVGKHPYVDGDKVTYAVEYPGSRVTRVSKATYDALTGVPDNSTPSQVSYVAKERARVNFERERDKWDISDKGMERRQKVEAAYTAAVAEHQRLSDEDSARTREWQAEAQRLKQQAFDRITAERGISFD